MSKTELDKALDRLNKQSPGIVYKMKDGNRLKVERLSFGRLSLDIPVGGGYPKGRIIEIYGGESSGKTTITLHAIAAAQKRGEKCMFVDYEHAFDPDYAEALGVNVDELYISQPSTAEQGLNAVDEIISTAEMDLIVVDSVAAMTPKSELEGNIGDSSIGVHARLMSQTFRKIAGKTSKTGTTLMFINQTREKIGVMFGNPVTTTGGNALKFYSSVRIEIGRGKADKENELNQGWLKTVKNKVHPPYKKSEFDLEHGKGISFEGDLINYAVEANIIKKAGSWFSYDDTKLGQGKENAKQLLIDNPELTQEIYERTMQIYFPNEEEKEILNNKD